MFTKYVNENSVLDYKLETVLTVVAERYLGLLASVLRILQIGQITVVTV